MDFSYCNACYSIEFCSSEEQESQYAPCCSVHTLQRSNGQLRVFRLFVIAVHYVLLLQTETRVPRWTRSALRQNYPVKVQYLRELALDESDDEVADVCT